MRKAHHAKLHKNCRYEREAESQYNIRSRGEFNGGSVPVSDGFDVKVLHQRSKYGEETSHNDCRSTRLEICVGIDPVTELVMDLSGVLKRSQKSITYISIMASPGVGLQANSLNEQVSFKSFNARGNQLTTVVLKRTSGARSTLERASSNGTHITQKAVVRNHIHKLMSEI